MNRLRIGVLAILLYLPVQLFPRNRRKIVFGAWTGTLYADNPRYLFEYLLADPTFKVLWIGNADLINQLPQGAKFAPKGSFRALWHLFTAYTFVFSHSMWEDFGPYPIKRQCIRINCGHGIPLKHIGEKVSGEEAIKSIWFLIRMKQWIEGFLFSAPAVAPVSSADMSHALMEGYPELFTDYLPFGSPRGDFLLKMREDASFQKECRNRLSEILSIDSNKKWVLYLPTWRKEQHSVFSFSSLNAAIALSLVLKSEEVLVIEKQHFHTLLAQRGGLEKDWLRVISADESKQLDTLELLLASDLLITDYSSCYFDAVLMGLPVIHFVYDYDYYTEADAGLRFELKEVSGGPICRGLTELIECLQQPPQTLHQSKGDQLDSLLEYEKGHACEQITVWLNQQMKSRSLFFLNRDVRG